MFFIVEVCLYFVERIKVAEKGKLVPPVSIFMYSYYSLFNLVLIGIILLQNEFVYWTHPPLIKLQWSCKSHSDFECLVELMQGNKSSSYWACAQYKITTPIYRLSHQITYTYKNDEKTKKFSKNQLPSLWYLSLVFFLLFFSTEMGKQSLVAKKTNFASLLYKTFTEALKKLMIDTTNCPIKDIWKLFQLNNKDKIDWH